MRVSKSGASSDLFLQELVSLNPWWCAHQYAVIPDRWHSVNMWQHRGPDKWFLI